MAYIIFLSGCDTQKPVSDVKGSAHPYAGQEVELLVPKSLNLPAVWEVQLQEWMTQTGATIRWNEYSPEDEASLGKTLEQPAPTGGRIVLFPLARLSELEGHLVPLDTGRVTDFDPKDLLRGLRERIVSRDKSLVAIPISAPVLACYFRADLLRAAGLKPPETWDDYEKLLEKLDQWAPMLTAVEPLSPDHRTTTFFARSLAYAKHPENYSVWFDLETGKPIVDSEGFARAAEMAQRAWKHMPRSIASMSPQDCRREILEGRAALAIAVEPMTNSNSGDSARSTGIEIGVRTLPGSRRVFNRYSNRWDTLADAVHAPGLCGFDGQAIGIVLPTQSKKEIAVWHLLSRLVVDQFESSWASLPKTLCRESHASVSATWHETGLTVEESSQHADGVAQTLRSSQLVADFPIPASHEFRQAASDWIGHLLDQPEQESATAIKQLQESFEKIADKIGIDNLRREYRRGLGLPSLNTLSGK